MKPKDEIDNIILKTKALLESYNDNIKSGIISDEVSLTGGMLRKIIVPYGLKTLTKDAARIIKRNKKLNLNNTYLQDCRSLLSTCEHILSNISQKTKNITKDGNSNQILRKLNKIRGYKTPDAFLRNLSVVLTTIKSLDLIFNKDIPTFMSQQNLSEINIRKHEEIINLLNSFTIVQENLLAAIHSLEHRRIGSNRNCITSCHVAIEKLCIDIGREKDWKKSLKIILPSKSDQKMVKYTWNYLSGKGAHGGYSPTKEDALFCLDMTISTIKHILNRTR